MLRIAWTDVRVMQIRNSAVLAALALLVLTVPVIGLGEGGLRILARKAVFALGFAMSAARSVGWGDMKLGAALMLFVPTGI